MPLLYAVAILRSPSGSYVQAGEIWALTTGSFTPRWDLDPSSLPELRRSDTVDIVSRWSRVLSNMPMGWGGLLEVNDR